MLAALIYLLFRILDIIELLVIGRIIVTGVEHLYSGRSRGKIVVRL
jgi:hypothetical protein